ncbi:hypothetical protein GAMM_40027 [Gammaproteobacteria bacterium]
MADLSKTTNKFDLQKLIGDVKSMLSPVAIPEANKDDPIGYCLSQLSKLAKDLAENHSKQADTIAKISTMLGTLHQEVTNTHNKVSGSSVTPPASETKPAGDTKETK